MRGSAEPPGFAETYRLRSYFGIPILPLEERLSVAETGLIAKSAILPTQKIVIATNASMVVERQPERYSGAIGQFRESWR
jgi:hypothetical protein